MKRLTQILGGIFVVGAVLTVLDPILAGRSTGPARTVITVPAAQSVYFDIPFDAGVAIASVNGNSQALVQVYIYDSDGHVSAGVGPVGQKTARMNVYRSGMFRVQVVNYGLFDYTVVFSTN